MHVHDAASLIPELWNENQWWVDIQKHNKLKKEKIRFCDFLHLQYAYIYIASCYVVDSMLVKNNFLDLTISPYRVSLFMFFVFIFLSDFFFAAFSFLFVFSSLFTWWYGTKYIQYTYFLSFNKNYTSFIVLCVYGRPHMPVWNNAPFLLHFSLSFHFFFFFFFAASFWPSSNALLLLPIYIYAIWLNLI